MPSLAQEEVSIDADIIATMLTRIYRGKYGNDGMKSLDRGLFEATHETFNRATASGIADAVNRGIQPPSAQFLELLDRNNAIFSAFRSNKFQKDVASMLLDSEGRTKSFADFRRDVAPIVGKYNGSWLRTEYATAVQRSRLATKWQQFVEEQDVFPNLEWVQSTALHPGEDHKIFWYTVRPVDDPFWTHHRPGDRWNCQCDLRQTDLPPTDIPTVPINDTKNSPAPGLDNNPGTDGQIFNDHHPYFPKNCTACPFANVGKKLMCLASKGKPSGGCLTCKRTLDIAEKHKRKSIEEHREDIRLNYEKYKELKAAFVENIGFNHEESIDRGKGNAGTGILRITPISIKNTLKAFPHSPSIQHKTAFMYIIRHPELLKHQSVSYLADEKPLTPERRKNREKKIKRGVFAYHRYYFTYKNTEWVLGLEEVAINGEVFEQPYFIAKK